MLEIFQRKSDKPGYEDIRLVKFDMLMEKVMGASGGLLRNDENGLLGLIYDYDKLNDMGKIIFRKARLSSPYDWANKYPAENLKKPETKKAAAKELCEYFYEKPNESQGLGISHGRYNYIFSALMILAVDKTDKEEKLSMLCDFAVMMGMSADDLLDVIHIVKLLMFKQKIKNYKLKTNKVRKWVDLKNYKWKFPDIEERMGTLL